jgi:hypothetical protein
LTTITIPCSGKPETPICQADIVKQMICAHDGEENPKHPCPICVYSGHSDVDCNNPVQQIMEG